MLLQSLQDSVWPHSPGPESCIPTPWSVHIQSLFCTDSVFQDPAVLQVPQQSFKAELDGIPSVKEITKAIEQLRSGKEQSEDEQYFQEKCREQNKELYVVFVDLTKAFDTVSRKGMWMIIERLGCLPKVLQHGYPTAQRPVQSI